ncbi:hypothetical protein JCM9140_3577 [Halalkalibacter wakoensis JCM 9140]|uniref:Uncharacterized protein n=1 Tax=Halalkalibacter wakoensis JCM 9140 TaxID=1236970 RepID=W4Q667_9BACI|nr:hypothetical protein [Halalkalibacter wakoensis]GAE27430.1 hypothetical protein JCM9140_3577 [Halalkalibacter wakoensis JCM 9140]
MDHHVDYDRDKDREDALSPSDIVEQLKANLEQEEEMMRTYLILAERIHHNDVLKTRLENFAEGNAKRSRQLLDEIAMSTEQ